MTVAAFVLCHALLRSRAGYYWQAIREDSRRRSRWASTPCAGSLSQSQNQRRTHGGRRGVPRLLLQQPFSRADLPQRRPHSLWRSCSPRWSAASARWPDRSWEHSCSPRWPRRWARSCVRFGIDVPGVKQVFYGVCLLLVVMFLPDGIWPPLSRCWDCIARLRGAQQRAEMTGRPSSPHVSSSFSRLRAVEDVSFAVPEARIVGLIGPKWRWEDDLLQFVRLSPRCRRGALCWQADPNGRGARPELQRGVGRTFQLVKPFRRAIGDGETDASSAAPNAGAGVREAKLNSGEVDRAAGGRVPKRDQMVSLATLLQ